MWLSFSVSFLPPPCNMACVLQELKITQALQQLLVEALNTNTFYPQYLQYLNYTRCLNAYAILITHAEQTKAQRMA